MIGLFLDFEKSFGLEEGSHSTVKLFGHGVSGNYLSLLS